MDAGSIGALTGLVSSIMFFAMIAAIVIVPRWLKVREREALQGTLRTAIEKGQPLPPEVIDAISRDARPAPSAGRDLRRGVILLCVAAAFVAMGYAGAYYGDGDTDGVGWLIGLAAFPGFVGVAFLIMAVLNRGKDRL
jgi:hypothetical protein